ncbi:CdaR family protein [Evansella sp. LMS18]|uniref:CdaR family protein n=1 Tax=Evansella sp. LMS18 TaxID=2924033 RepID=UPI0020CFF167|nr:CdaR family protein [Evansella sp. LMS18]UTR12565.1 CdaR family protein [Evansella sp. LMS18]
MDKWFNNTWVIKGISLLIAVMLFLMVNLENRGPQPGGIPGITNGSRVLEEVQLNIYYDEDQYVVTEAPESVQVTVRGPQNVLTMLQIGPEDYEVYLDLREREAGTHYERVRHRNFPPDLSVSIVPMTVRVTIQEKQTVSLPVEIELINAGEIEEGYSAGTPSVQPSNVDITAAQSVVDQIAGVRAVVDLAGRDGTFQETAGVEVLDEAGNVMDLNTDPPAVEVMVPITSPNKEVPVRIEREGQLPGGLAIESIVTDPEEVTIFGPVDVINDISFIDGITLDLSDISGSGTYEVEVPVPRGVESVSPETINVIVEVTEEETREFSDFPIEVTGIEENEGYEYEFIIPEDGVVDFQLYGSPNVLGRISREDLQIYADAEGLDPGEHTLPLQFSGPQNVRASINRSSVRIVITENEEVLSQALAEPDENEETFEENNNDAETEENEAGNEAQNEPEPEEEPEEEPDEELDEEPDNETNGNENSEN